MKQHGYILIVSMVFLLLMTILSISMFGGFAMDETMSGNYREKSRALDAAQTALIMAENVLIEKSYTGNWNTGANCTAASATQDICSNPLNNPTSLPWAAPISFTPANMSLSTTGGLGTYADHPYYYIQYLGVLDAYNALYRVTATSSGGNSTAAAMVQSVYRVHANSSYLGGG